MLSILQAINLGLRFLLELCTLAAFGYWGFHMETTPLWRWLFGLGAPVVVAVLWGLFAAPASTHRLTGFWYYLFQLFVFGGAVWALYSSGRPTLGLIFGVTVLLNLLLLAYWKQ
ncbi:MAG TPA: YrdB family protein [Caldilineaceae bacterium]|mgnify:CR=1 FL=1|nr:YrdB family protein [Caldilineaceae bacterium]